MLLNDKGYKCDKIDELVNRDDAINCNMSCELRYGQEVIYQMAIQLRALANQHSVKGSRVMYYPIVCSGEINF